MINNKIKYILVLFIILSLSMNAFSATNFTDDSIDVVLQSSDSVDEVAADAADNQADDETDDTTDDQTGGQDDTGTGDAGTGGTSTKGNGTFDFGSLTNSSGKGNGTSSFDFGSLTNRSGNGTSSFDFGSLTNRTGNGSSFDFGSLMDIFSKLMGGNNTTNATNTTNPAAETHSDVSNVPRVVTSTSYVPVSYHPVEKHAQHIIQRLRDNQTICKGDALKLDGVNKLYESDFTNGHLLVYVDGKLVFNEITGDDLDTPIFWITDDYLGQHQISVEFTANGNSNTNTYTEDVLII